MKTVKVWYIQQKEGGVFNIRYLILWFMVAIYPLLVIPHPFTIKFLMGFTPPNYYYLPRYIILGIIAIISLIILLKDKTRINDKAFVPLFFFIIFATVSGILAPIQSTAWLGSPVRFTGLTTYYFCIILFILAQSVINKTEGLLKSLVYTGAIVSILAILQYFGINLVPNNPMHILTSGGIGNGTMPHPNFLGTYTVFILPGAFFLYLKYKNIVSLCCANLIFLGLLVSQCRGTWIAFFIVFLLIISYVILKKNKLKRSIFIITISLIVVSIAIMFTQHGILLARLFSLKENYGMNLSDTAGSYRIYIWRGAFHLFLLNWPFGIGPDHLIYAKLHTPANEIADKAHNIYLEMGLTMGIFTLASYLIFITSILFKKWRNEIGITFILMIVTYLMQGFTNIDVVPILPLFWIILGLLLSEQCSST